VTPDSRTVEIRRGNSGKAPRFGLRVKDIGHGPGEGIVKVHRRDAQNLFIVRRKSMVCTAWRPLRPA